MPPTKRVLECQPKSKERSTPRQIILAGEGELRRLPTARHAHFAEGRVALGAVGYRAVAAAGRQPRVTREPQFIPARPHAGLKHISLGTYTRLHTLQSRRLIHRL